MEYRLEKILFAVKESEIICITGGTEQMNRILALEVQIEKKKKKKVCFYIGQKN